MGDTDWYMDRDLATAMNLYFADPATDSYDLKAEQSALARLKQVSGNAGSIVSTNQRIGKTKQSFAGTDGSS